MNKKDLFIFNRFFIIGTFIFSILVIGATYSYMAYRYENSSVIVGNIVGVNATLNVELIVGSNDDLVPLQDEALTRALVGEGSPNGACIDSLNNLSCQVYRITLTNNGSKISNLKGTIELSPKSGTTNKYQNLKWRELTNATSIKSGSVINSMQKSTLIEGLTLNQGETATYYIALYLQETDTDQRTIDTGEFQGVVTFETVGPPQYFNEHLIKADGGTTNLDTALTTISSKTYDTSTAQSTTGGLYQTVDDYSIDTDGDNIKDDNLTYFYRGAVSNNWVEFGGFLWRVIRINGNGSIRMIYSGSASSDSHTGSNAQLTSTTTYASGTNVDYGTSTIKGVIDTWYSNNIANKTDSNNVSLTNYISDEIFCNDKKVASTSGSNTFYGAYNRLYTNKSPSLICSQETDKYTVSSGRLSNPVALITADEVSYAGGESGSSNIVYYLYTGSIYWTMAPYYADSSRARVWRVLAAGNLSYGYVDNASGARPVINLISEILYDSGDGSEGDPYKVKLS